MSHRKRGYCRKPKKYLMPAVIIVLAVSGIVCVALFRKNAAIKKSEELQERMEEVYREEQEKIAQWKQKEDEDSFYQKLADGFDVNILVVGDSIAENGQGEKGWCTLLRNALKEEYCIGVQMTNVSMGGEYFLCRLCPDNGVE